MNKEMAVFCWCVRLLLEGKCGPKTKKRALALLDEIEQKYRAGVAAIAEVDDPGKGGA